MSETRKTIALAIPGENYSAVWLAAFLNLHNELSRRFNVVPVMGYSSNVYATRARILQAMVETDENVIQLDYTLWLDDDNTLTWPQFEVMLGDLDDNDSLDAVAGWTWIQPQGVSIHAMPSCGNFALDQRTVPLDLRKLVSVNAVEPDGPAIIPVDYTGFPAVLFKFEPLRLLSVLKPFSPYPAEYLELGFMGEDTGFWFRAKHAGIRLAVDRRVFVPHYKLRAAEPVSISAANVSVID